jgi:hypothetical protein
LWKDIYWTNEGISQCLKEHISGWGAKGIAEAQYRPHAIAAYMSRLAHLDKKGCENLEKRWKKCIHESMRGGTTDV